MAEWPGFRGPERNGIIHDVNIETDWETTPPVELWRRQVGTGCSSFAVQGNYFFTQEQRENLEMVTCYNLSTGEPVWIHKDEVRFYDQHAGAGPRATPTLKNGKVFTLGATGILNVLQMENGSVLWSSNIARETGAEDSGWGFTSSPLVTENLIIAAVAGNLIACEINSGKTVWTYADGTDSYSSAHLYSIDDEQHIIFMNGHGATGINLKDGNPIWDHSWPCETRILQPVLVDNQEILMNSGQKKGIRKIKIEKQAASWKCTELWTSNRIRPDFNDFVVHKNHLFGFDGPNLACIELEKGQRKWRGSRYGGQLVLLADQDLLIVLSEKGEVALVEANPDEFIELSKIKAIEGKTWNHPVLVDNTLLVRNTKEMVAYRLN
jgi:outer membrane protein assembly factor BamB